MTTDLMLPLEPLVHAEPNADLTIQQKFEQFHDANPWVYRAYVTLTRDLLSRGKRRVGIGMLTEVIRWQYDRATSGDEFRINNNFRSRYVRLMIDEHPEWSPVFETRVLRAA